MQYEITRKTPLLLSDGTLAARGYAKKMNILYNREKIRNLPPRLKEWNFYQIQQGHHVLQITLGHVSYMCSVNATLMDLDTGNKWEFGTMKPLFIPTLDTNPEEKSHISFAEKDLNLSMEVLPDKRILTVRGRNDKFKQVDIAITLDNDPENEKMVIATPFRKRDQFYLNYKENYYSGTGHATFDGYSVSFDGCTALLDWGRGIWPYRHEWFWGNLTSQIDSIPFGFNIGWGFGDLSMASENMVFYNKKAYKLGHLTVDRDESDYMKPWRLTDEENGFLLEFTPFWDNYTENKFVVVDTHCNQVFGKCSGHFRTETGTVEFKDITAFIEHAVNRW